MAQTQTAIRDTVPRVQHIAYFQAVLEGIARSLTYDALRTSLRQVAVDLARRSQGRVTASRVEDAYTFWSPTTDAIGELMRLGLIEHRTLPSKRTSVDAHRDATYELTGAGREMLDEVEGSGSAFQKALTPVLIAQHPYLAAVCRTLAEQALLIPEYTEEELKAFKQTSNSWIAAVGADAAARMRRAMSQAEGVTNEVVTSRLREWLRRRFPTAADPTPKDVLDTVHDALIVAALEARGLRFDATTFNILASWGRQLFVLNESRYVHGLPGRSIWSTADITSADGGIRVERRRYSAFANQVVEALLSAYREIADARGVELGGGPVVYPYLEIFKVRALAAYRVRVNDPLVDHAIAELAERKRSTSVRVELALGTGHWPASSETRFGIGSRRFNVILIKPEGQGS